MTRQSNHFKNFEHLNEVFWTQRGPNSLHLSIINIISTSTNLLKDPFFTTKCLTEMIFPYKITRTCLVILDKFHTLIFTQRVPSHRKKTQEWWIIINTGVYVSLFNVLIKKMINCSHLFLPIIQHLFNN